MFYTEDCARGALSLTRQEAHKRLHDTSCLDSVLLSIRENVVVVGGVGLLAFILILMVAVTARDFRRDLIGLRLKPFSWSVENPQPYDAHAQHAEPQRTFGAYRELPEFADEPLPRLSQTLPYQVQDLYYPKPDHHTPHQGDPLLSAAPGDYQYYTSAH